MSNISASICLRICFFLNLLSSPEVQMQGLVHAREELYDQAAPLSFHQPLGLKSQTHNKEVFLLKKKILSTIIKVVREICELASI